MLTLSQLYVYPIKSLAGISVASARVTDRGLAHDRRYMLVTPQGQFITIRQHPVLTRFRTALHKEGGVSVDFEGSTLDLPAPAQHGPGGALQVVVWDDTVRARTVSDAADRWFTERLGVDCHLVYMPDASHRPVELREPRNAGILTSFADGYPFLLIGEASMQDLNDRLAPASPLDVVRFRPNIVCRGAAPYAEDGFGDFTINGIGFAAVKPCARCGVPNVDPVTAQVHAAGEPLATLSTYRKVGRKINFGVNLVHSGTGVLAVGDVIVRSTGG
ncbi:putative protein YcbX [Neolewinella maritima]|uniref:MOSC domain-containing protein n=1 Tax=Neolewinella maritima TaxID=1383882 RepID=A0ABN8F011_9BACT|nr:MOSC N-terminal beta barrel domain-containing protein [Neolewinella maritima]CAH0999557.1 putative protein YcbX [Neolewinella maritima]